jgi:hypothetical protein
VPANVELLTSRVSVRPGELATVTIRVTNTGRIVDEITLEPLGDAAAWMSVAPASLALFPGALGQAQITFAPPRGTTPTAGTYPFAVRVRSREDRSFSYVAEGRAEVAALMDVTARMGPRTSLGGRRSQAGTHRIEIDNGSNTPAVVQVAAADADERMTFVLEPDMVTIPPGGRSTVRLRARAKQRLWNGQPAAIPFQVVVTPQGAPPIQLDGGMTQRPTIIPGLIPLAGLAAAGAVALGVASQTILQPAAQPTTPPASQATVASAPLATLAPLDSAAASAAPTGSPVPEPTAEPTAAPTAEPTAEQTAAPTAAPTAEPTAAPTDSPSPSPLSARIFNLSLVDPDATPPIETPVPTDAAVPTAAPGASEPPVKPLPSWPTITVVSGLVGGAGAAAPMAAGVAPAQEASEHAKRFQQFGLEVVGPVTARISGVPDNSAPRLCIGREGQEPQCRTDQQTVTDDAGADGGAVRFVSVVAQHGGTTVNLELGYAPQGATLYFKNIDLGPTEAGAVLDILVRPTRDDLLVITANEVSWAAEVRATVQEAGGPPGAPMVLAVNRTTFVPVLAGRLYAVRLTTTAQPDVFVSGSISWP